MTDSARARADALFERSTQTLAKGDFAAAESDLREALRLAPALAEAHANLAWLLERQGAIDEALVHYQRALAEQPDNARIHLNHGALLAELKAHDLAEAAYRRALVLDPELPGGWSNLGALLALMGRDNDAEASFRIALAKDSSHALAHFNLACLLLRKGRFEEGWQHLEARDWYAALARQLDCRRWRGEPLQGRSVLVGYEAGHGDMIQFSRYVPKLRERGAARVDLVCHPALKDLLSTLAGVGTVTAFDEPWLREGYDFWVPVLSLPHLFDTRLDSVPSRLPYLRAPADRLVHWRNALAREFPGPDLRVGLVWHGNPDFQNDSQRSVPSLGVLAPLWQVPGVRFISLQKGRGESEACKPPPEQPILEAASELNDFSDTAALVAQLDLVISVDTAVVHLCGALGKPCWLMLPAYMTDWRWLEGRSDSPWYPAVMRLFRQSRAGDWAPVIEQVRLALEQWANAQPDR
jgi:Tfp pilus assembly protein PilF